MPALDPELFKTPVTIANHDGNLASLALQVLQKAGCPADAVSFIEAARLRFVHVDKRPVVWSASQAVSLMEKAGFELKQVDGVLYVVR